MRKVGLGVLLPAVVSVLAGVLVIAIGVRVLDGAALFVGAAVVMLVARAVLRSVLARTNAFKEDVAEPSSAGKKERARRNRDPRDIP